MAPRALPAVTRGRPKRVAPAPLPEVKKRDRTANAPVAEPQRKLAKRGRPTKDVEAVNEVAVAEPTPRRHVGRPRKEPVVAKAPTPKKLGRAPKEQTVVVAITTPSKRPEHTPKEQTVVEPPVTPPKRRGRPPKTASARIIKKTLASRRTPRVDPRVRSRLRTRVLVENKAPVLQTPKPKKRVGRPSNNVAAATPAEKSAENRTKDARVTKPVVKLRKQRGFTNITVPDKLAKRVKDYLAALIADVAIDDTDAEGADVTMQEPEGAAADDMTAKEMLEGEVYEQRIDELQVQDQMDGSVDGRAKELFPNGQDEELRKPIEDDMDDVANEASDQTLEVVEMQQMEVETEIEIEEVTEETQTDDRLAGEEPTVDESAGELLLQQEITEEIYDNEPGGADSLFENIAG